ncbi:MULTISPECIES: daptide-type RiPP [Thalassomonas]
MTFEEIEIVDAPSDAEFWGGVAGGVVIGVAVGLLFVS